MNCSEQDEVLRILNYKIRYFFLFVKNLSNVKVEVRDNILTLSGEKKQERKEESKGYYWKERIYGSFTRSFTLPATVESGKAKAAYKDGVLTITLPKVEEAKPKQIPVESN